MSSSVGGLFLIFALLSPVAAANAASPAPSAVPDDGIANRDPSSRSLPYGKPQNAKDIKASNPAKQPRKQRVSDSTANGAKPMAGATKSDPTKVAD